MDTDFETQLRALWARGFSPQTIADSLDVTEGAVCAVAEFLELGPGPKLTMDQALEDMGLSEAYRAYVRRDEHKAKRVSEVPVADRGRWGEYLRGEAASTRGNNKRPILVDWDGNFSWNWRSK